MKLFDSELKVMEVLWRGGELPATAVVAALRQSDGWNKNTTYTVLNKLVAKGAVARHDPGFTCRALVGRGEARRAAVGELLDKFYDGSASLLCASLLEQEDLTPQELADLRALIDRLG